jgi:hypothetical protein
MKVSRATLLVSVAAALALAGGCASSDEVDGSGPRPEQEEEDTPPDDGTDDPKPEVCPDATGVYEVSAAQSNLLFLLDRSGSMHLAVEGSQTRWTATKTGLFGLFDVLPSEVHGGVTMFPSGDAPITCCTITSGNYIDCSACGAGELPGPENRCLGNEYQSAPVGITALDSMQIGQMKSFVSTGDDEFYWGTPLAPALGGALDGVTNMSMKGVTSVVLLTDGLPTSCHTDSDPGANDIGRALDAAVLGEQAGIRTYVVGIDAEAASSDPATDLAINLSALAMAGGTARFSGCEQTDECAYIVNADNFEVALATALEEIALEAISCSYELPEVEGTPDYDKVNITVQSNGQAYAIPQDTAHTDGWDYLPGNQEVQLYGPVCELLKSDADAVVEVVVGCATEKI